MQLHQTDLNPATYARYMRVLSVLQKHLGLRVRPQGQLQHLHDGDIFLFNHFTRFETAVPPYLIHQATGAICLSVGDHSLFEINDKFAKFLRQVGGISNHQPELLPHLAAEILRGRKVVIFPEGGLIKDKSVQNRKGGLELYSPSSRKVRKPHRGAAALALLLDAFKDYLRTRLAENDEATLLHWQSHLGLSRTQLSKAVEKPTLIVPAGITFYPLRISPNLLARGLQAVMADETPPQVLDELVVESNLLFRKTDMDIHFGPAIAVSGHRSRALTLLMRRQLRHINSLPELFALRENARTVAQKLIQKRLDHETDRLRDEYMRRVYGQITINLNHLAATLISVLAEREEMEVPAEVFHKAIYLAIKRLQQHPGVNLHCSLSRPRHYVEALNGTAPGLAGFLHVCRKARLIRRKRNAEGTEVYRISYRLRDVQDFHEVRLENPVRVHTNEVAPLPVIRTTLTESFREAARLPAAALAALLWDDELRAHADGCTDTCGTGPLAAEKRAAGQPYLLLPPGTPRGGVLLIHGFTAAPAQLRPLAQKLQAQGFAVMGMRLPGHGTTPEDLEGFTRTDWHAAVARADAILAAHAPRRVIIGFSTGAALGLAYAAGAPAGVVGVIAAAPPLRLHNPLFRFMPGFALINRVASWFPGFRNGLLRWHNPPLPSPENYPRIPVAGLVQLYWLLREYPRRLKNLTLPVLLLQGTADQTIKASHTAAILGAMGSTDKQLIWVPGAPHHLLAERQGVTWPRLNAFLARMLPPSRKPKGVKGQ